MRLNLLVAALLFGAATSASAQIVQSGTATAGHALIWATSGVAQDAGTATAPATSNPLNTLGIVNSGTPFCISDAAITGSYHQLCLGANSLGGGLLSYNAYGGAAEMPLNMNLNGVTYQFPFALSGIVGPSTTAVGDVGCWNNTVGTLLKDCGSVSAPIGDINFAADDSAAVSGPHWDFRWDVNWSDGSTSSVGSENLTVISAAPTNNIYGSLFKLTYGGTGGATNYVPLYAQSLRQTYVSGDGTKNPNVWAFVAESRDETGQPSNLVGAVQIGSEIDVVAQDADPIGCGSSFEGCRAILALVGAQYNEAGAAVHISSGLTFSILSGSSGDYGSYIRPEAEFTEAILDGRRATQSSGNAVWLKANQTIGFDTLGGDGASNITMHGTGSALFISKLTDGDTLSIGTGANTATYMDFADARGFVGYVDDHTVLQGSTGKGASILVNSLTFGTGDGISISSTGAATWIGLVSAANCSGQPRGEIISTTGTGVLVQCP